MRMAVASAELLPYSVCISTFRRGTLAQEEASVTGESNVSNRILTEILRRLEEAQEPITISAAKLATSMDIPVAAFRARLHGLFSDGRLVKISSGLAGTRIAAPGMTDAAFEAPDPAKEAAPVDTTDPDTASECGPEEDDPPADALDVSPADSSATPTPHALRTSILAHLKEAITTAGGEATITMAKLASAVGTSVTKATYHVKALADLGHVVTSGKGSRGTTVRLGSGTATPQDAAPSPNTPRRAAVGFCPWCGTKVGHPGWRFCHSCGEKLAR